MLYLEANGITEADFKNHGRKVSKLVTALLECNSAVCDETGGG
jgi:hypothetical protein